MSADHVTRAELSAHLDPMREDIAEIKGDVKELRRQGSNTWLGPKGKSFAGRVFTGGVIAAISALVAGLISLLT